MVDQPIGTGMSKGEGDRYLATYDSVVSVLLEFLEKFLAKNTQYTSLYLTGESLGGKVLVRAAYALKVRKNRKSDVWDRVEIKGLLLISPWIDAISYYDGMIETLRKENKFVPQLHGSAIAQLKDCVDRISSKTRGPTVEDSDRCFAAVDIILDGPPMLYKYHLDYPSDNYYTRLQYHLSALFRSGAVRSLLKYDGATEFFKTSNGKLASQMKTENLLDDSWMVLDLIKSKIPVKLVYGDKDLICNPVGTLAWIQKISKIQLETLIDAEQDFVKYRTNFENFSMIMLKSAGHIVCWHNPRICIQEFASLAQ